MTEDVKNLGKLINMGWSPYKVEYPKFANAGQYKKAIGSPKGFNFPLSRSEGNIISLVQNDDMLIKYGASSDNIKPSGDGFVIKVSNLKSNAKTKTIKNPYNHSIIKLQKVQNQNYSGGRSKGYISDAGKRALANGTLQLSSRRLGKTGGFMGK